MLLGHQRRQVLGAPAERRVLAVGQVRVRRSRRALGDIVGNVKVRGVELGKRWRPNRLVPSHAVAELTHGAHWEVHELEGCLQVAFVHARYLDRVQSAGDLLDRLDGEAAKVGSTNLGEQTLHQDRGSVVVGDDDQGTRRSIVLLDADDGKPEEPGPQRLEPVKLLRDGLDGADLLSTLEERGQLLCELDIFLVVLQVSFDLLDLGDHALEGLEVFLARLVRLVIRGWRRRSRREGAALVDEVAKLRLVLPVLHGIDDLFRLLASLLLGLGRRVLLTDEVPCMS